MAAHTSRHISASNSVQGGTSAASKLIGWTIPRSAQVPKHGNTVRCWLQELLEKELPYS